MAHPRRDALVVGDAEFVFLQLADLVSQAGGFLQLEVGGGLAHALVQVADVGAQIVADEVRGVGIAGVDHHAVAGRDMGDDVAGMALDRLGVMPCRRLYSSCFSGRGSVSLSARSMRR